MHILGLMLGLLPAASCSDDCCCGAAAPGTITVTVGDRNYDNVDLSGQTINSDGAYTGNDLSAQGVVKVPNSQLNGTFVVPVTGITLTLGLYDAAGAPLKTWTVLNDTAESSYNIVANHFYALGTKIAKDTTTGTAEHPISDAPIDLMKDQAITVSILPNWALIHNMTIQ